MAVAGRRVAGAARARDGSLSAVRSAITRLVGGGIDDDNDSVVMGGLGVKAARMEAEHVVLEAVQVRLRFGSPPPPPVRSKIVSSNPARDRKAVVTKQLPEVRLLDVLSLYCTGFDMEDSAPVQRLL